MSAVTQSISSAAPPWDLSAEQVAHLAREVVVYHRQFRGLFYRKEQRRWALKYLQGLLLPNANKCVERLALSVPGGHVRNMQKFLGAGLWDDRAILRKHAELVAESLGEPGGALIVDGSEFPKKGKYSAGVMRQYCGATGKIDNCQAGVFVGYASARGHTLLDRRLYLPQAWFEQEAQARWKRCEISQDTSFRTKPQLAWGMIEQVVAQGVAPFSWVLCDESFGDNPQFLEHLEAARITYLAEVAVSTRVWLERPQTRIAPWKGNGRPPSRERIAPGGAAPLRLDQLAAQLPRSAWRTWVVKEGEKGPIRARFAFVRAVAVRGQLPGPQVWVMLRRSLGQSPELKVYLSNAAAQTPRRDLVRMSGMRWPIETCFEEAKGNVGMASYQTRSWLGWHHHMTLALLAHHFLVRLALQHKRGHRRLRSLKSVS
jgi:SRSO17 transposase